VKQPDGNMKANAKSRSQMYRDEGKTPPVESVPAGSYLIEALFAAGPSMSGAMGGEAPLSWSEIHAFMAATSTITEPWEAQALFDMSRAYVRGKDVGRNPFGIYPGFDQ
jgi:hypothetical protein